MSALLSILTPTRPRFSSSNSDTSLFGLDYLHNSTNVNDSNGDSPTSRSHTVRQESGSAPTNANANALQMVQPQSQHFSDIQGQQVFIDNNEADAQNADSDSASWTGNPQNQSDIQRQHAPIDNNDAYVQNADTHSPSWTGNPRLPFSSPTKKRNDASPSQKALNETLNKDQPIQDHTAPSKNPIISEQQEDHGQHVLLPKPISKILSSLHIHTPKPTIVNQTPEHQLQNRVIITKTWTPTTNPCPQLPISLHDENCLDNDNDNRSSSPNDAATYVSSLSADESHTYFSDIASVVQIPTPIRMSNSDVSHCHSLEMHQIGEEHVGTNDHSPYNHPYGEHHRSLDRNEGVPHHLTFTSPIKPRTFSAASTVERRNYPMDATQSQEWVLQKSDGNDEQLMVPRNSQHLSQGCDVRSLELNRPPPYTQRTNSTTSSPCSKQISGRSRIRQRNHVQSALLRDGSNDSGINTKSSRINSGTTSSHPNIKKLTPRLRSSRRLRTLDVLPLPPVYVRSTSTSAVSRTSTSLCSSQYGSCKRNKQYSNTAYDQSIGEGSNSITSASYGSVHQSSIIVNGRVLKNVKHRRTSSDSACLILGGSGDDHNQHIKKHNRNSIYEAAIMGKLSGLKVTTALESQSITAQSSLESFPSILKHHLPGSVDDATMRSCGITDSSTNGITSASSGTTARGKRRRMKRRSMKDELKYLVGKIVPSPLRGLKGALTRQKSVDLERSKGCLT